MSHTADTLRDARIRVPDHVVHRTFVAETVVLNLQTGKYHGLNTMAGRMLEVLEDGPTVREAAARIAAEYDVDAARVESDLIAFCEDLLARELIEIDDAAQDSSAATSGPSQGS
jgi:hypothetical protein